MVYNEEDYLQLSGLQHFLFCRRQWALIHIEQQWAENYRTTDGQIMHTNAHNAEYRTKRHDILTVRGMKIFSPALGLSGECDIVEFHVSPDGVPLAMTDGTWLPYPVEYKRGTVKPGPYDDAQLCAQAICLEEMLCCDIPEGAVYYGEDHHRTVVRFTPELRQLVINTVTEMHDLYKKGYTPVVKRKKGCNACSIQSLCLPELEKTEPVMDYLRKRLAEEEG